MGGKRNKVRYTSSPKEWPPIIMTGNSFLQYEQDEEALLAVKGDVLIYPCNGALTTTKQGDYHSTGFVGYFKLDVHDGREWRPVLVNTIFTEGEHHFSKTECPIDTYNLCLDILKNFAGKPLQRTYREHYEYEEE
jgi:hypothetical protein